MTLVNAETGEIVEVLSERDARRLTERIRIAAANYTEAKAKVLALVDEAKAGQAHVALGYKSWTAYLSDVLSDEPLRLARDDRRELVVRLADEGMSTRAIAPIVGVDQKTVGNDLRATEELSSVEPPTVVRVTTGLDGRERTTTPRSPSRRALPDVARDLGIDLRRLTERFERLNADDRFVRNKNEVAAHLRHHLAHALKVLTDLEQEINSQEESTHA
ncbi:MAG: hypothetical protein EPO65_00540 [Dehalococcoidia bacterium]|nr:MAG: hypothetical protein EPO65_00540 [Dehalococcoidia bacterium]